MINHAISRHVPAFALQKPAQEQEQFSRAIFTACFVGILIIGAALRSYNLGEASFWNNEAASYYYAQGSVAEVIMRSFTMETNPPGFHLLIHFWAKVFGNTEGSLRMPSALGGILALPVMFLFARHFLSMWGSLLAMALLAMSPLHVWYSQECRAFAVWLFAVLSAQVCFLKWVREGRARLLYVNVAFLTAAASFHYLTCHIVLLQNLWVFANGVFREKERRKQWLMAQGVLCVCMLPFLVMVAMVDREHVNWWRESGLQLRTLKSLMFHWSGVYFIPSSARWLKILLLVATAAAWATGAWWLRRQCKHLSFLLIFAVLPVSIHSLVSLLLVPVLGNSQSAGRYFIFALPSVLVLLAAAGEAIFASRSKRVVTLLLAIAFLAGQGLAVSYVWRNRTFAKDDNRRLMQMLFSNARGGDLIVASPIAMVTYYADRYSFDLKRATVVEASRARTDVNSTLPEDANRIWLYFDPAQHFAEHVTRLRKERNCEIVVREEEQKLSGSVLYLIARKVTER